MHLSDALRERELDLELADVLPHRDTLGLLPINITVAPVTTVVAVTGASIATQVLTNESSNVAAVLQSVHF